MNDPVLNRTLFRHQAQIIHNKIPKLQQGGAPWYTNVQGLKGAWQAGPGRNLWDFKSKIFTFFEIPSFLEIS